VSTFRQNTLVLDQRFDAAAKQHHLNGRTVVFHCHHYTTLYTQLAIDSQNTDLLTRVAEDTFLTMISSYFTEHGVTALADRIDLGCQYYAAIGLGAMNVAFLSDNAAEIVLTSSHVDAGWLKKWGPFDKPVNYLTAGYAAALCSAVLGLPARSFKATEIQSVVMGAAESRFRLVRK
jgi:hypothetical protein